MPYCASTTSLLGLSVTLASALPFLAACGDHDATPPPRTVAALEHGLSDEQIGISSTPPIRRAPPEFDDADESCIRLFHDVLAPYGTWTDDPRLGLVWIPARDSVGESFVPYATHGRFTYREVDLRPGHRPGDGAEGAAAEKTTHDEYIWLSDLPWGWVTFHYGRWAYTGDRGWAWIAGRRYSGAWIDWRVPDHARGDAQEPIVGWGPTPPSHVWRISPGVRADRARVVGKPDPREAVLVPVPYSAFATPYSYALAKDLFAPDLGHKLLPGPAALAVAFGTRPAGAPSPAQLGLRREDAPAPPSMDRGLQQAWMLATPATAIAVGAGPELGPPPRLRTWVAGGPRWASMR